MRPVHLGTSISSIQCSTLPLLESNIHAIIQRPIPLVYGAAERDQQPPSPMLPLFRPLQASQRGCAAALPPIFQSARSHLPTAPASSQASQAHETQAITMSVPVTQGPLTDFVMDSAFLGRQQPTMGVRQGFIYRALFTPCYSHPPPPLLQLHRGYDAWWKHVEMVIKLSTPGKFLSVR